MVVLLAQVTICVSCLIPEISKSQMRRTDLTFYYMRYAEVLLIYAEAMAMQDKLTEALEALNEVRDRVDLPGSISQYKN